VHPLGRFGRASFTLPTEAHSSSTENRGSGVHLGPTTLATRQPAITDMRNQDRSLSLSLSPLAIRTHVGGMYPPLRCFFLPAEVSSAISSPPASHRAIGPFFEFFGGLTPLTRVLLLPQFAQSSSKDFGLHRASHRRPLLDTGELLLLCSLPSRRHGLMYVVVLCTSRASVGVSSPT
jgi:hypothetical protein